MGSVIGKNPGGFWEDPELFCLGRDIQSTEGGLFHAQVRVNLAVNSRVIS